MKYILIIILIIPQTIHLQPIYRCETTQCKKLIKKNWILDKYNTRKKNYNKYIKLFNMSNTINFNKDNLELYLARGKGKFRKYKVFALTVNGLKRTGYWDIRNNILSLKLYGELGIKYSKSRIVSINKNKLILKNKNYILVFKKNHF